MGPNFSDLPREIRTHIYAFYFASYASCPHGGCLKISTSPKSADKPLTSATAWCPAVEAMRTASKARNKEGTGPDLGNCLASHHPTGLLLANRTTYHEAAKFFLQELPVHFKFHEADLEELLLRWRHTSPAKNVRKIILDGIRDSWWSATGSIPLFASVLCNIEYVEIRLDSIYPPWGYEELGEDLRVFKSLRKVVIRDQSKRVGSNDGESLEDDLVTTNFHVPVTINGVFLEPGMNVYDLRWGVSTLECSSR
ncbi:hypothetical protein LTR15_005458 [Elasticomyces elasticus]|nr:hypothetical protein LTR15_005458 [Elasticomyces elasticus]